MSILVKRYKQGSVDKIWVFGGNRRHTQLSIFCNVKLSFSWPKLHFFLLSQNDFADMNFVAFNIKENITILSDWMAGSLLICCCCLKFSLFSDTYISPEDLFKRIISYIKKPYFLYSVSQPFLVRSAADFK